MKKKYLIFSFYFLVFSSCETDFDAHAAWEEITLVYGLLDQNQDRQYIKINKAFLGEDDALQMAQMTDYINYKPEDLEVKLYKLQGQDTTSVNLDTTTSIVKDDGLFASGISENIIYRTLDKDSDFVEAERIYVLTIENTATGNFVSASTELVGVPEPPSYFVTSSFPPQGFPFIKNDPSLPDSLKFHSKTISWNKATNGEIYQVDIWFNYKENNIDKSLIWRQPLVAFSSSMSTTLDGAKFFNYLSNNLEEDNTVNREFISLDLVITIGTSNLATYITLNAPFDGIVQERPTFSNIHNGLGLFSSRYTYERLNVGLSPATVNYLITDLNRRFSIN